jgi:hypothetical protein
MLETLVVWLNNDLLYPTKEEAPPTTWNLLVDGKEHPIHATKL